jgi:hypothetical protein
VTPPDAVNRTPSPSLEVPRALVEFILLGPEDDRRQLQDSPILGDVWLEFGRKPAERFELLITPYKDTAAAVVASVLTGDRQIVGGKILDDRLFVEGRSSATPSEADRLPFANIAFLQGVVAACLTFEELLRDVVPLTSWWQAGGGRPLQEFAAQPSRISPADMAEVLEAARHWFSETEGNRDDGQLRMRYIPTPTRYATLGGLILWAAGEAPETGADSTRERIQKVLKRVEAAQLADRLRALLVQIGPEERPSLVYTISLNRRANHAIARSVPAVKADAARSLFSVNCSEIAWAVLDSGIASNHPAFLDKKEGGQSRVKRILDFTRIRDIVSFDNLRATSRRAERAERLRQANQASAMTQAEAEESLRRLAQAARDGRAINWELVEPFVEIPPTPPLSNHGTHVAGIIGANKDTDPSADAANGMCPDIKLYDFRVLSRTLGETEFAIIAAMQFIRYINERNSYITIHGANLSLSIPHDVRNYACGRTPICNECERLVNSGVVVVAAAGNRGYQNFETKDGLYESYAAFSVTDPGNADGVITVGATHRYWPHTYGVSFFSSRGPTGDGRLKPDLVAPGERIRAPFPNGTWGDLDGTSMAAPHVSGAAALLLARYSELVGQPRRIKTILCDSATDLGRERTFQGRGMLDVLRAFQSI